MTADIKMPSVTVTPASPANKSRSNSLQTTSSDLSASSSSCYSPTLTPSSSNLDPTATPTPSPAPKLPEDINCVTTDLSLVQSLEKQLWNNQNEAVITQLQTTRLRNPRHALLYAEAHLLRCFAAVSPEPIKKVVVLFKEAIALAERYLDGFPNRAIKEGLLTPEQVNSPDKSRVEKTDLQMIMADGNLFSGAALGLIDKRLKAAWKFKKAWSLYSEALKKGPIGMQHVDDSVAFGNAIFLWMLGWLPPIVAKILEVLGFDSDRVKGIQMFREIYSHGGVRAPYAAALLLVNFYVIPRALADAAELAAEAQPVMTSALAEWPDSLLFQWLASFEARKRGDTDNAMQHLDLAIRSVGTSGVPPALELDKCFCQVMQLKWAEATPTLERLASDTSSSIRGMCSILWASCLSELGQKEKAQKVLLSIPPAKELLGHDKLAGVVAARCRQRATGPSLVPYEILYLRRDLAHMKPEMVAQLLATLEQTWDTAMSGAKPPGREEAAVRMLLRGAMLRVLGKVDDSLAALKLAAEESTKKGEEFKEELHVCPFAYCELAEIYHKQGNLDETERCFLVSLKTVSGGVYEDFVRPRLRLGLEQVRQEKKAVVDAAAATTTTTTPTK